MQALKIKGSEKDIDKFLANISNQVTLNSHHSTEDNNGTVSLYLNFRHYVDPRILTLVADSLDVELISVEGDDLPLLKM